MRAKKKKQESQLTPWHIFLLSTNVCFLSNYASHSLVDFFHPSFFAPTASCKIENKIQLHFIPSVRATFFQLFLPFLLSHFLRLLLGAFNSDMRLKYGLMIMQIENNAGLLLVSFMSHASITKSQLVTF